MPWAFLANKEKMARTVRVKLLVKEKELDGLQLRLTKKVT